VLEAAVTLRVQSQHARGFRAQAAGEQHAAGAGRLAAAGGADEQQVMALAERHVRAPGGGHRQAVDARRPAALPYKLALTSDEYALPTSAARTSAPLVSPADRGPGHDAGALVIAQLAAGSQRADAPAMRKHAGRGRTR
jgi:hypothetical protein